jgi:hypothetical protein
MNVKSCIDNIKISHSVFTIDKLSSLMAKDASIKSAIVDAINKQNSWLYLVRHSYDGWYCVENETGWQVYFQEKGAVCYGPYDHKDHDMAISSLIELSGVFV